MHTSDDDIARDPAVLQHVVTRHPHDPPFTYTIGLADQGLPELVVVDLPYTTAGYLLQAVAGRDGLQAGRELQVYADPASRVRLQPMRERWIETYASGAVFRAARRDRPLEVLQVVWADPLGRLPGEGGRPAECACCPDFTRSDRPYALPFDGVACHGLPEELGGRTRSSSRDVEVCLPVRWSIGEAGRVERVRCRRESEHTVRLLQPPMLADWTTAGAVLALESEPDVSGAPLAVEELQPSRAVHLTWSWQLHELDDDDLERVGTTLQRLESYDDVELSFDVRWLAVAATSRSSAQVRSAMRHLVRDGLAAEASPFSAWEAVHEDCDVCAGRLPGRRG